MTPERLQELLNAFVDEQLDAQGQRELAKALETDEEARRAFVRASDQHQALRDLLGSVSVRRRSWAPLALVGAVAAAAVLAVMVYLLLPEAPTQKDPGVAVREKKAAPPKPPDPVPPIPEPKPLAKEPNPIPDPVPPAPTPVPKPPEKTPEPKPLPPEPKPPELPTVKPTPPPPPQPKETAVAVATLENVKGDVVVLIGGERKRAAAGQAVSSGQGLAIGAGNSAAVLVFPDATRLELKPGTILTEISATAGKRVVLDQGSLYADVAKQPAGQPMLFATKQAEASILGTKLTLSCAENTKLELKEGRVHFTRLEDKKGVDVVAGQSSIAGKGLDLTPKKITRGHMMANAIFGEDFQDPVEFDKDWSLQRNGILVTTQGQLDFDVTPGGVAGIGTRETFTPPFRITVDVEYTQRLKNTLLGLRLLSWKEKEFIHIDLDDERYYIMMPDQNLTADLPARHNPRRERWTLEVGADGSVIFLVDGKQVVKARRADAGEDYHLNLITKATKDVLAGSRVRFDNLVVERLK